MLPFLLGKQMAGAFAGCQEETAGKSKCTESGEKRYEHLEETMVLKEGKLEPCLLTCRGESERETGMLAMCAEAGPRADPSVSVR